MHTPESIELLRKVYDGHRIKVDGDDHERIECAYCGLEFVHSSECVIGEIERILIDLDAKKEAVLKSIDAVKSEPPMQVVHNRTIQDRLNGRW